MARFILLVSLLLSLTGRLVHGVTEDIKFVKVGYTTKLQTYGLNSGERIESCDFESNRGEALRWTGCSNSTNKDKILNLNIKLSEDSYSCSIDFFNVNMTHAGTWKITAYVRKQRWNERYYGVNDQMNDQNDNVISRKEFVLRLHVSQKEDAVPSSNIIVYDGQHVNMKHETNYENLTACILSGPSVGSINLLTEELDNVQLFGQCGVNMKVNHIFRGFWTLCAVVEDYMQYNVSFKVQVYEKKNPNNMTVISLIRDTAGKIKLENLNPKICQIMDPSGVIVTTTSGACQYSINVVTARHEGVWLARYSEHEMLEPIEEKFRVEVFDQEMLNASISYTEDGNIRLLCQAESPNTHYLQLCRFIRPDGIHMYITPDISNERYSSYVNFNEQCTKNKLECGIIIQKFEDVDRGAWRCNLILYECNAHSIRNNRFYGTVLRVDHPDSREDPDIGTRKTVNVTTDEVYVKRGDEFTIKCVADAALKYCWLRSPNRTSYSIEEFSASHVLRYHGMGLSFGECGAKIPAAVDSDDGQWTCLMGVIDGNEETATVPVSVTETYLMAEQTEIAASTRNDPALSCRILPHMLDRAVHYCRWIRPDGYGIYNDISHRYTTGGNYTHCRLVILNYRPEEDNGEWTCVAGLKGEYSESVEEASAYIRVYGRDMEGGM